MIELRRVYEPRQTHGTHFLVERLWPRGIRKESLHFTDWLKDVAPSDALRRWFQHDTAKWTEFQRRYRIELDLAHSPSLQRFYGYEWAPIGNLGVDLLIIPLAKLFGLEPAAKLIVLAIPALTAIGMLWVAREVHGRIPPTALMALPFIYSFPFLFGFLNFSLSVALAFLSFGLWLHLARTGRTTLRGWLFALIAPTAT